MQTQIKTKQEDRNLTRPTTFIASIGLLISSLLIILWVGYYCNFGFDLTDEGFYLNWISKPFNFSASPIQFGFLYHPLYLFLNGDIAMLRQVNLLVSLSLGAATVWLMLEDYTYWLNSGVRWPVLTKLAISLSFATATLCSSAFNGLWLFPTPSYNSAAFQGLLITVNGLLLIGGIHQTRSFIGWGLIGLGGWVTFMGKPTSAALLSVAIVIYLLCVKKFFVRQLFISIGIAFGLLLMTSIIIDGSIIGFINRNLEGLKMMQSLGGHPKKVEAFFNLPNLESTKESGIVFIGLMLSTFIAALLLGSRAIYTSFIKFLSVIIFFFAAIWGLFYFIPLNLIPTYQRNLLIGGVGLGGTLFFLMMKMPDIKIRALIERPRVLTFLFLIVTPYIYAFGSNNNYWVPMGCAVFFGLLASLTPIAGRMSGSKSCVSGLLAMGLGVQFLTVTIVSGAFSNPYRNPNHLELNEAKLAIGIDGNKLFIPKAQDIYLTTIANSLKINGFKRGWPMIDLTGHSPGVLYFLGADVIGAPWLLGGYPGSEEFAVLGLQSVKCELLLNAWLLVEPGNSASIPYSVLLPFGRSVSRDYEVVSKFVSPEGLLQQMLKPISFQKDNFDSRKLCESARSMVVK